MSEPRLMDEPRFHAGRRRRWVIWWRFGWPVVIRSVRVLPIAEWRKDVWLWRLDCLAMDVLR